MSRSTCGSSSPTPDFSFLTSHGKTLLLVAHDPRIRMRDIAALLHVTERANCSSPRQGTVTLTASQRDAMLNGQTYVNIQTRRNGSGEIRGQITHVS